MKTHRGPRVYVFRDHRGTVWSVAAGYDVIDAFGDLATFDDYFAGHATFGWPPSQSPYLGVWGSRNCGRFRRILRDRHGELAIAHRAPPARLTLMTTAQSRPDRTTRIVMERGLSA